ncbi:hypothetical protein [Parafilimonas sp.]|uniref:hypothetical protein n=1 Tax=Parafilimonas sp. TaxID=1969739 RepID=UPI0039E4C8A1
MHPGYEEAKLIIEAGKIAGAKAIEENFALDLPVVVAEGDCIVEFNKKGQKKIIKKIVNGRKAEQS